MTTLSLKPTPLISKDDVCQVCKQDRYLKPDLKLLVSPCSHKLCDSCIDRLFKHGAAPCPICRSTLKKSSFVLQTFEDLYVEKEIKVRKRVQKYFNKRQEDFKDLRAYNDYLEEVEDILFNLINDVNVQEMEEKIERYKRENQELIQMNIMKQLNEDKATQLRLEQEKQERAARREAALLEREQDEQARKREERLLLDELASSSQSANQILRQHAEEAKITKLKQQRNAPAVNITFTSTNFTSVDLAMDDSGPFDPLETLHVMEDDEYDMLDEYTDPYMGHLFQDKSALAGGYTPFINYQRSLEEAFCSGLFIPPKA
ncbi:CDK-activating kinase assembly factor MAT1-domain-containing protein [Paraphysoderma sedebokerense]|nr:CDK-activating kinase assembly factor MAT1-domain-containing protein [Paraphysoderma sedebokerense]